MCYRTHRREHGTTSTERQSLWVVSSLSTLHRKTITSYSSLVHTRALICKGYAWNRTGIKLALTAISRIYCASDTWQKCAINVTVRVGNSSLCVCVGDKFCSNIPVIKANQRTLTVDWTKQVSKGIGPSYFAKLYLPYVLGAQPFCNTELLPS